MRQVLLLLFLFIFFKGNSQITARSSINVGNPSKGVFNADGYYFLVEPIRIGKFNFEWLVIFTNYDCSAPKLRLRRNNQVKEINASSFKIDKDSSYFHFKDKTFGNVSIIGRFTGKLGPTEDNLKENENIVFKGKMLINSQSFPLSFTYSVGD